LFKLIKQNSFFKNNSYLLAIALVLLAISIFTQRTDTNTFFKRTFSKKLQAYLQQAETNFEITCNDNIALSNSFDSYKNEDSNPFNNAQFFYLYKKENNNIRLSQWNTQTILPDSSILKMPYAPALVMLANGYYFLQKKIVDNNIIISLMPVKWNYIVANEYLKNEFIIDAETGNNFDITQKKGANNIVSKNGHFLFSLQEKKIGVKAGENRLTIWLRILSFLPLLLFIHFTAVHLNIKKGLLKASIFLAGILFTIRLFTYFFASIINFRQFELFDPAIYGTDMILRSLGDLLINALLFLWIINFVRTNVQTKHSNVIIKTVFVKWLVLVVLASVILFATYTGSSIIRSMVADAQISFDVMNFFSLNVYSFVGFLVLSCIAIAYYYFCTIVFFFVNTIFKNSIISFFTITAVLGLLALSFSIGHIAGGFELYGLLWLLLFLLLVKNDLSGFFSSSSIVSKMVFWLFFFSGSIALVIIVENNAKELRNRRHYAEVLATKTNTISDVLLNTILTEFRPEVLSSNFNAFKNEATSTLLRDSLINNNLKLYTDNYDTKILMYDSAENAMHNEDSISFTNINGLINTQAKATTLEGMYYVDAGYDSYNYIAKRTIKNKQNKLLGYAFLVIKPMHFSEQKYALALFSRASNNTLENSLAYAYAIYENGKLTKSHNDYAFSTRYSKKNFVDKQFLSEDNKKYNELWYNAGSKKYVVIVKENKWRIELITLFSYLFCTFILLNALSSFINLILRARFRWRSIKKAISLSIRQQVHGTIISFSILSFIIIGIATIVFFTNSFETNNHEMLSRTSKIIGNDVTSSTNKKMIDAADFKAANKNNNELAGIINKLSIIHGHDINLYDVEGNLKASSLSLPYEKGIVSTKINPTAYAHLSNGKEIQYYQKEQIGELDYVSNYIPVLDSLGKEMAFLNVPFFTSQTKLKEEISTFLVTIIILNAFILLIAGIIALIITNRITNSFAVISEKMKQINLATQNEAIKWNRKDEIGALVIEYNKMVAKLDESAAALARTERESAWQEMAKQVAHEIKNPLTPMKLSMQFLQKAIEEDADNLKELSARVSATLVQQIDHLSNIAGEFSRFANIEKANAERFDINEVIISVKQLYQSDKSINFTWTFTPNPIYIIADKTHVNRTLTNLILNGIQAVPTATKPTIIVEQKVTPTHVSIKITDNGTGIPAALQANIFAPNFTTKTSGTGLGLSMCKRMVEQAGGQIFFSSSKEGTSFIVEWPQA
jgi:two-component system, NtrC family, nitrogen regulation sensor histidine kinase NtrY